MRLQVKISRRIDVTPIKAIYLLSSPTLEEKRKQYPAHLFFPLEELHHPSFLKDVSRKARERYYKILFNEKLSIAEQKRMIMEAVHFPMRIIEPLQEEVKRFYGKMGKRMEQTN
ncbi:unnamed protein product, partial [Haemonchus placei]|uniref:Uncharacterized protein n=1 Tax=Haemonchus placei TaxID=6290 RepID=A0A0N4X6M8_HAEPC